MIDYSPTFGHLRSKFVTLSSAIDKADDQTLAAIDKVAPLLEYEADENLVSDHFHPEIAGPLQTSLYFLQLVKQRDYSVS